MPFATVLTVTQQLSLYSFCSKLYPTRARDVENGRKILFIRGFNCFDFHENPQLLSDIVFRYQLNLTHIGPKNTENMVKIYLRPGK
jgi:hypothetical protein